MAQGNIVALLLVFLAISVQAHENSQQKSSGFKKVPIERKKGLPNVEDFFKNFVVPRIPVVFEAELFVLVPDFRESDLATSPLSITTYVQAKKNGDSNARYHLSVRQFVKRYRKEQLYLDDSIPTSIKSHVPLPRCLLCKTVFDELLSTRLLFHHGNQKSGLLATGRNFLGCQITGTSKIHFFSPMTFPEQDSRKSQDEEKNTGETNNNAKENKIYLNIDKGNQTYLAKMKAGDCVYIPAHWLHQWKTNGNSVNVGLYWSNKKITPTAAVCANQSEQNVIALNFKDDPKPDLVSLFVFHDLQHFIKNYFPKNEEERMTFKTFEKDLQKDQEYMEGLVEWNAECRKIAEEMFQQMDTNDDGILSLEDFDILSYEDLKYMAGKIDDRLADFKDIFEDQAAEQKGSLFDTVKNSADNYAKDFRSMIEEEFDEIFREVEAVSKDKKDEKEKNAVEDQRISKETTTENVEFESVRNLESETKEPNSEKRSDVEDMSEKENRELKNDPEMEKDEL